MWEPPVNIKRRSKQMFQQKRNSFWRFLTFGKLKHKINYHDLIIFLLSLYRFFLAFFFSSWEREKNYVFNLSLHCVHARWKEVPWRERVIHSVTFVYLFVQHASSCAICWEGMPAKKKSHEVAQIKKPRMFWKPPSWLLIEGNCRVFGTL